MKQSLNEDRGSCTMSPDRVRGRVGSVHKTNKNKAIVHASGLKCFAWRAVV